MSASASKARNPEPSASPRRSRCSISSALGSLPNAGQRQRVSLARALAVEPEILLMDEPFSALDALTRETLQDELIEVRRRTGKTVLFVTHDIDEAAYLADRVVVLSGAPGQIIAEHRITAPHPRRRGAEAEAEIVRAVRVDLGADIVSDGAAI